jgi:hypothetical protein
MSRCCPIPRDVSANSGLQDLELGEIGGGGQEEQFVEARFGDPISGFDELTGVRDDVVRQLSGPRRKSFGGV